MLNSKLRSTFYCILGGALFSVLAPTIALAHTTVLVSYAKDAKTPFIKTVPGESGEGHVASLIGVTVSVKVPPKFRLMNLFGFEDIVPYKNVEDTRYQVWSRDWKAEDLGALFMEGYDKRLESLGIATLQPKRIKVGCAGGALMKFPVEQGAIYCPKGGAITFRNDSVAGDEAEQGHATLIVIETPQEWRLRMGAEAAKDKYEAERMAAMEKEIAAKDAEEHKARDAAIAAERVAKDAEAKAAAAAKKHEAPKGTMEANIENIADEYVQELLAKGKIAASAVQETKNAYIKALEFKVEEKLFRRNLVAKQAEYEALLAEQARKEAELAALEARRQESVGKFLEQIGGRAGAVAGQAPLTPPVGGSGATGRGF